MNASMKGRTDGGTQNESFHAGFFAAKTALEEPIKARFDL